MKSKALGVAVLLFCVCVLTSCSHGVENNKGKNQPSPAEKSVVSEEDSKEINYDKLSDEFICKDSILLGELYRRVQYKQWDLTDDQLKNFNPRYLMKCILDKHFKGEVEYWIGPGYVDTFYKENPESGQYAYNTSLDVIIKKQINDDSLKTLQLLVEEFGLQDDFHNPYQQLIPKDQLRGTQYKFYLSDTQRFKWESYDPDDNTKFRVSTKTQGVVFDDKNNVYIVISEVRSDASTLDASFETQGFVDNHLLVRYLCNYAQSPHVETVLDTNLQD